MKVLLTGFDWYGDLIPFVRRGLSDLTSSVSVVTTDFQEPVSRARIPRYVASVPLVGRFVAGRCRSRLSTRVMSDINARFRREVARTNPDVVLSILCWGEPLTSASIRTAARATRVGWLMDDPFGYERSRLQELLTSYDRLYTVDEGWAANVELMTGIRPVWLPCGADLQSHHPIDPSQIDSSLEGHIVYVGSSCYGHPAGTLRQSLIEALRGLPVAVFGDTGWRRFGGFAASSYRGGPVDTFRANVIYASAAIAVNFHHPQFRCGTSLRTFALCASGIFQLVDWREGLDRWLVPGRELEVFRSPQELRTLATWYLSEPAARRCVANAGRTRVLSEHTYAHRLRVMLGNLEVPIPSPNATIPA